MARGVQASLLCAKQVACCVLCTLIEDLLSWLTGVDDSAMQSAVAAIAVQLAGVMQQVISDDPLPSVSISGNTYSTKPWDRSTNDATHDSEYDGAAMGTLWPHLDKRLYYRGRRANTHKLVVVAFELFQSLIAKAKQAGTSIKGADILFQPLYCCKTVYVHAPCMFMHSVMHMPKQAKGMQATGFLLEYMRCWLKVKQQ